MRHIYTNLEMSLPTTPMVHDLLQPNVKALKTNLLSSLISHEDVTKVTSVPCIDPRDLYSVGVCINFV